MTCTCQAFETLYRIDLGDSAVYINRCLWSCGQVTAVRSASDGSVKPVCLTDYTASDDDWLLEGLPEVEAKPEMYQIPVEVCGAERV